MILDLGTRRPGSTFDVPFHTFDSNDPSASVIVSAFVVGDVAVYKDGSITQRASTSGYTLLDTDGINFDGVTGCHGVSIDLADNTTAGFWEAGSRYMVLIGPVTVDAATINFWAARFDIGYPDAILNTTIATLASQTGFTLEEGPADNDALNGCPVIIHDLASAVQIAIGYVDDYVGSSRTVTLAADPAIFTMAAGDNASFMLPSNVRAISGDTVAADNLELMYDTTGYTDQTAPASRSQVDAIGAASGGSVNIAVSEDNTSGAIDPGSTTKVWATVAGTFANTEADNGLSHDFTDTGNDISHVYGFQVGGGRLATSVSFIGNVDGNNDEIQIEVWDHVGADWEVIGTILGSGGTINRSLDLPLLLKHTGTSAAEIGKVYIQMDTNSTTPSDLSVELLLVSAVNIGQTGGYALGRIWINTGASNINTEIHVDGVSTNPVSTIAAAKTLSNNSELNLSDFQVINGSTITLAESTANESYFGDNWTLALGGQACGGAHFEGATVSGVATGAATGFHGGEIGTVTLGDDAHIDEAGLSGTITLPAGSINIFHCHHDGATAPVLDFGAAVGSTTVHMHHYSGAIELQNFGDSGTDVVHLDGHGKLIINANSSGGTINLRGNWDIEDNDGNAVINYDDQSQGYDGGQIWIDTVGGTAGTNDHINGTSDMPCLTLVDAKTLSTSTGLSDFHIINGSSIALAESTDNESYFGDNWTLDLSDESVDGCHFNGATVSGAGPSAAAVHYEGCNFTTASLALAHCDFCAFAGTVTQTTAGDYEYHNCYSKGTTAPIFTKTAGQAINVEFHNYSGDITISGVQSGDVIELGGNFRTIILNGADATVHIHGHYQTLTNNITGADNLDITGATKFADAAVIRVKTDQLTFTKANELDANTKSINDAEVIGDGNATPWDGV